MSNQKPLPEKEDVMGMCPECGGSVGDVLCSDCEGKHYEAEVKPLRAEIERLRTCLQLAQEVGADWRNDWSDFDGRTLRDQMDELEHIASGEMTADEYRTSHLSCKESYE